MSPSRYLMAMAPPPDPPIVRDWKAWISSHPDFSRLEVELSRSDDRLVRGVPMLVLYFRDAAGNVLHSDAARWDADLERYLLEERQAQSVETDSEILRFALLLNEAFKPVWYEVDGGYFDAVLVQLVREGDYRNHPAVREVLKHADPGTPSTRWLEKTRAFIEDALRHVGGRLLLVRPDVVEADDILARALASWMDDRFSVSSRRMLGMLPPLASSEEE